MALRGQGECAHYLLQRNKPPQNCVPQGHPFTFIILAHSSVGQGLSQGTAGRSGGASAEQTCRAGAGAAGLGGHGCLPHCHLAFLTAWQPQGRETPFPGETGNIPGGKAQLLVTWPQKFQNITTLHSAHL